MKNKSGKIIYVGKAKVLKNRVSSYFSGDRGVKTEFLVRNIDEIEYIETQTEYEALLLENNYIKEYKPRYNINLKDGKTYPVIRLTAEKYPRIFRTRTIVNDGSRYWGPFPEVKTLEIYLKLIEELYPLRKCKGRVLKKRETPCLYYHIDRCPGLCAGKMSEEEYGRRVVEVEAFLSGKTSEVEKELIRRMETASTELQFEKAAEYRDLLKAVEKIKRDQIIEDFSEESRDYLASIRSGKNLSFALLRMREGKIRSRELFRNRFHDDEEEAYSQFLLRYYEERPLPDILFIDRDFNLDLLAEMYGKDRKRKFQIRVPQRGRHERILSLARRSAEIDQENLLRDQEMAPALLSLQKHLGMSELPERIEGFDIAHLAGKDTVSSLVSFYQGKPDKKNYRKFKIRSLEGGIDDFQAISEAVSRRYSRLLNEKQSLPDLILVDGGKGQVSAAHHVLSLLDLGDLPLAGLAKRNEEIFLPGIKEPIMLEEGDPALRILQQVRDETHRFATGFNQQLRRKRVKLEILESVPGIGKKRAIALIKTFGSVEKIAESEPEYIAEKGHVPQSVAESLVQYLAIRKKTRT